MNSFVQAGILEFTETDKVNYKAALALLPPLGNRDSFRL